MPVTLVAIPRRVRVGVIVPGALVLLIAWGVLAVARDHGTVAGFAEMWLAMSVAMMVPTVVRPMMRAADGSVGRAWTFAAGFVAVWLIAGVPTYIVMSAVEWTPFWLAAAWIVAGAYQLTPAMQRQLRTCRSIRYEGDAARYGVQQGWRCVASCWPLMVAVMVTVMAISGTVAPLLVLVSVTALLCWEKHPAAAPRAIAALGIAMLLLAGGAYVTLGGGSAHPHSSGTSTS